MTDILIRGMKMPKDQPVLVFIWPDGRVFPSGLYKSNEWDGVKAVPLPEGHGRLIDADAFKAMCLSATKEAKPDFIRREDWLKSCAVTMSFCRDIDERPTIVPEEGGSEDVQ